MRKIIFTALLMGIVMFISCQKDKEESIVNSLPEPKPNYFPLAIGNYWVYENHVHTDGVLEVIKEYDSIVIIDDTLINDYQYYVFESFVQPFNSPRLSFYRDSSSYIVDIVGNVHFTIKDPGEIFFEKLSIVGHSGDTSTYQTSYLDLTINDIEIPAGNFKAISMITDVIVLPQSDLADSLKYRSFQTHFIDGIGRATNYLFYASGHKSYDKKLIRYHIEEQP